MARLCEYLCIVETICSKEAHQHAYRGRVNIGPVHDVDMYTILTSTSSEMITHAHLFFSVTVTMAVLCLVSSQCAYVYDEVSFFSCEQGCL